MFRRTQVEPTLQYSGTRIRMELDQWHLPNGGAFQHPHLLNTVWNWSRCVPEPLISSKMIENIQRHKLKQRRIAVRFSALEKDEKAHLEERVWP